MIEQSNPFQSVIGLGAIKSVHGFSRFYRNNRFIMSGVILMGIFSCICLLAVGLLQDAQRGIQSQGLGFTFGMAGFMILLALFIIFWMMQDWLKNRNYAAALFDGGVAIQDQEGKVESVAWKDVDSLQVSRLPRSRSYDCNIICKDGRILVIRYFLQGFDGLVKSVQQSVNLRS
jgi:hypothetical protein